MKFSKLKYLTIDKDVLEKDNFTIILLYISNTKIAR